MIKDLKIAKRFQTLQRDRKDNNNGIQKAFKFKY